MSAGEVIIVACPSCSQKYRVPESRIGHRAVCKKCGQHFRIAIDAPIDEDTLFGWVMEGDPDSESVMGSTAIFDPSSTSPPRQRRPKVPSSLRIRFDRIDDAGANFEFPANTLADPGLRMSFPLRCANCLSRESLNVHLLIWGDKLPPQDATRLGELESKTVQSFSYLRREYGEDWLDHLAPPASLPAPYNLPFPYYVCRDCGSSRAVTEHVTCSSAGDLCQVAIANLSLAVEFYRNNGGRGTPGYQKLLVASRQQRDSEWTSLPFAVRSRISQWFALREGEQFLGYYPDTDLPRSEAGTAGLILTDRRMVHKKHTSRREYFLHLSGVLEIDADKSGATIAIKQGSQRTATLATTPLAASSLAKSLKSLKFPWIIRANIRGLNR